MSDKVWLIWASQGEYSDRSEWPLHAYADKASAEYAVLRLEALYRSLKEMHDRWKADESEDACEAEDYDWDWAEKKAFRTKEGRQFRDLYGAVGSLTSGYDLHLYCCEIAVRPPNLGGAIAQSLPSPTRSKG